MRKPFDVLVEGLLSKNSRGDWTPLELFLAGTRALALESHFNDALRLIVLVKRRKRLNPDSPDENYSVSDSGA
jgi:hypothetical protein